MLTSLLCKWTTCANGMPLSYSMPPREHAPRKGIKSPTENKTAVSCVSPRGISKLQGATVKAGFDQPGPKGPLPPQKDNPSGATGARKQQRQAFVQESPQLFQMCKSGQSATGLPFLYPCDLQGSPWSCARHGYPSLTRVLRLSARCMVVRTPICKQSIN